jgi:hypothetical protein
MNQLSRQAQEAIEALQRCHAVCHSMAMLHCLEAADEHARPQHIRLMLDCAAVCQFTADAIGRKSQFHNRFAALCAEVCLTCAQDCENIGGMEDSAEVCRRCAGLCEALARLDHAELLGMASRLPPS